MKKLLLAAAGLLALGMTSAGAADLGSRMVTKAPPMMPVAYNWTGFYVGANGGGGWGRKCWDIASVTVPFVPEGCHDLSGGVAGGQIGYRWQASSWVFGLEAQGDWARLTGSTVSAIPGVSDNSRVNAFGLFTGQVGYTWSNVLLYVKGGAAVVADKYDHTSTITGLVINSGSETRWGGVAGAGLEYGFLPNWSVALEYDHLFMGTRDVVFTNVNGVATDRDRIKQDVDLFTARLNYRFDWGGPVVARY
jgi:outer membrane immunogenic protein